MNSSKWWHHHQHVDESSFILFVVIADANYKLKYFEEVTVSVIRKVGRIAK